MTPASAWAQALSSTFTRIYVYTPHNLTTRSTVLLPHFTDDSLGRRQVQ